jgi:hypothetical protein
MNNPVEIKYQMYFDTVNGEKKFDVGLSSNETLDVTLNEVLEELKERGHFLKGTGLPQVLWNGRRLDFGIPLPQQGVRPNDVLRINTMSVTG